MNDPNSPPGINFVGFRVIRSQYESILQPPPGVGGELALSYDDQLTIEGGAIIIRQNVLAQIVDLTEKTKVYLQASVELEGRFECGANANVDITEFANNHAPALLFAFTREWIHKLTSSNGTWPAILLPPVNVLMLRKQRANAPK